MTFLSEMFKLQVCVREKQIFKCFCSFQDSFESLISNLVLLLQRYGPPPSYPHLKIPGLNAPIPEGASFGYHAGGWGKPPVDEVLIRLSQKY